MRSDIDRLMAEEGVDVLLVVGPSEANADLAFITRGASVSGGPVVKKRGCVPILLYHPMEIEGARASGCEIVSVKDVGLDDILRETPDRFHALVLATSRIVERLGIRGRVQFAGRADPSVFHHLVAELVRGHTEIVPVRPAREGLLVRARLTKDEDEVARIREVGRRACRILGATIEWLAGLRARGGELADGAGPVTIGRVKARLRSALAEEGMTDHGHTIFAQGSDGAHAHSRGNDSQVVKTGVPIVFDFFPQELGGYWFDMTRTFCLGSAPREFLAHFDLVRRAFDAALATIGAGAETRAAHEAACQVFEDAGHPTQRSDPKSNVGYHHSLGHGIGLDIHEDPVLGLAKSALCSFEPGMVFTVEPGLYYPEKGFGVRIEDVVRIDVSGRLENLTDYPVEPVVPLSRS
ncbi:MAG: aminopeptidase P family protein [Planctomycetes bacterium]|nr:aminopeptidase P family protein [Planctomycetota bacterium]